jgi:membrane protease YdiL (CAAX protease family)
MNEKLMAKDFRFILVCVIICLVSLFIGIKYFYRAFPEASIDFKVTQKGSLPFAADFLKSEGLNPEGFKHKAIFTHDDVSKVFLERELGLEKANKIMGSQVKLWRWSHRWFKPLQKEEYKIDVTTRGEIAEFEHLLPEEAEGENLSKEDAQKIAVGFLVNEMKKNPDSLDFVLVSTEKRPKRTDHTFTWSQKDFNIKDATYRYEISVYGDKIGGYREYLKVPDEWVRSYEKLRSLNDATATVAALFLFLTILAVIIIFLNRVRNKDIRWKTAFVFGVIAFALTFLASLNSLPLTEFSYQTTESYGSFLIKNLLSSLLSALGSGMLILLLTASAESLYREHYKRKISLTSLFKWKGIRSKNFFLTVILGFTLTFFFFAYQIIFYLIAGKYGAWSPADIPYSEMLNTKIPWIFVLLIGFFPAVSEEFLCRMFSIPFLQKYLKLGWLAVVIPAFIWGFGHANYPNQPFFIRGLEVGIAGIIIGIIMIRFNILAVLVWHYTVDALYTAFLLFRSGNTYFTVSAAITTGIMLIPLLVALIAYLLTRKFENDTDLLNDVEGTKVAPVIPEEVKVEAPSLVYQPLSKKRILIGGAVILGLLCLYLVKIERFGSFVNFSVTKNQAENISDGYLKDKRMNLKDFRSVTFTRENFNEYLGKYILEREGMSGLNRVYGENLYGFVWITKYYKPLQKEEYIIGVDPKKKKDLTYEHIISEDDSGAFLEKDSAQTIVNSFLLEKGIDTSSFSLKESKTEKRKNRTDYNFVWEAKEGDKRNIDEAKFRMILSLQGDEVARFYPGMKIPEKWERERKKSTVFSAVRMTLKIVLIALLTGYSILFFVRKVRKGEVKWKRIIILSLIVAGFAILSMINEFPSIYKAYPSYIPLNVFTLSAIVGMILGIIGAFMIAAISFGLLDSFYPDSICLLKKNNRRTFTGDAFICAFFSLGLFLALRQLKDILIYSFPKVALISSLSLPEYIETSLPFISSLNNIIFQTVIALAIVGSLTYCAKNLLTKLWHWIILILWVFLVFVSGDAKTLGEFLFNAISLFLWIIPFILLIKWFLRSNFLAYVLCIFLFLGVRSFSSLLSQSAGFYKINGLILMIIVFLPLIWIFFDSFQKGVDKTKFG